MMMVDGRSGRELRDGDEENQDERDKEKEDE